MKFQLGLLCIAMAASLRLAVAQNVTDCTDISASLGTTPIDPVIGEKYYLSVYM